MTEKQTDAFRRCYLYRVLSRGSSEDLRAIGFEIIYSNLPRLNLPPAVRRFWEWYFNLPDVKSGYESANTLSTIDQDNPYRLQSVQFDEDMGMQVENPVDFACTKLSALFDGAEPKDFVDVCFICQEVLPFEELVEKTKQKHRGLDDYWLAVALQRVEQIEMLPRMIKSVTLEKLKHFFLDQAKKLMGKINTLIDMLERLKPLECVKIQTIDSR